MAHTLVSPARDGAIAASPAITPEDGGKFVLRVTLGILMLLHGLSKLSTGPGEVAALLGEHGLPGALAYLVYVGEVLAPLLLIVGFWTRPAALLIAVNMLVAIALAHGGDILARNESGGWAIELQGLYLFGAIAVALIGAGRLSVGGTHARFN